MPNKKFEKDIIEETSRHTGGTSHVHVHDGGVTITTPVSTGEPSYPVWKDHQTYDNNGNPK